LSNARGEPFDCTVQSGWKPLRDAATLGARILRSALPQRCTLCVAVSGGALLCEACAAQLPVSATGCPICALPGEGAARCRECGSKPPPFSTTIAAFVYAFPVDRLIQRIKYGGNIALIDWAAAALAAAVRVNLARRAPADRPQKIAALPLALARQRQRGFNQAGEIARRVSAALAIPMFAPLERARAGPPQAALPWSARRRNVRGAFALRLPVQGLRIALVDDVMTTGATLAEAARVLVDAGAANVECWVVARTPLPERA
jgi:ComF family protein